MNVINNQDNNTTTGTIGQMIEDIRNYEIEIRGSVDQDDINVASPVKLSVVQAAESKTLLSACTDQAGLIGIMRHLQSLGLVLLSIQVKETFTQPSTL